MLKFANKKFIPGCVLGQEEPWLRRELFSAHEVKQLLAALELWGISFREDALFAARLSDFDGIAEVPIEWWDILGEDGAVKYQLWLYATDSGTIFLDGSTEFCAELCQFGYDGDDEKLAESLVNAQESALIGEPDCELASYSFAH